jgi:hypothetical protein
MPSRRESPAPSSSCSPIVNDAWRWGEPDEMPCARGRRSSTIGAPFTQPRSIGLDSSRWHKHRWRDLARITHHR